MKKLCSAFTALTLALSMAACAQQTGAGASGEAASSGSGTVSQAAPTATPTPEPKEYVVGFDPLTGEQIDENDRSRPIAVMIQNNKAGYPQWGIKGAEVLVEAITEGKTTSMMAMYSGHEGLSEKVGAVGPARDLFWQIAMPTDSILMQIGGNIYASNLLNTYEYQNLDGHYVGVTAFDLDYEKDKTVNHEYCWYTTQSLMEAGLEHYGMSREGDRLSLFNYAVPGQEATPAPANSEGAASASAPPLRPPPRKRPLSPWKPPASRSPLRRKIPSPFCIMGTATAGKNTISIGSPRRMAPIPRIWIPWKRCSPSITCWCCTAAPG